MPLLTRSSTRSSSHWPGPALLVGCDRSWLLRYNQERQTETITNEWHRPGFDDDQEYVDVPVANTPMITEQTLRGEIVTIRWVADLPDSYAVDRDFLLSQGTTAILEFPMIIAGTTVGTLGFEWVERHGDWIDSELPVLNATAGSLSQLLARQSAEQARQQAAEQYEALVEQLPDPVMRIDREGRPIVRELGCETAPPTRERRHLGRRKR